MAQGCRRDRVVAVAVCAAEMKCTAKKVRSRDCLVSRGLMVRGFAQNIESNDVYGLGPGQYHLAVAGGSTIRTQNNRNLTYGHLPTRYREVVLTRLQH